MSNENNKQILIIWAGIIFLAGLFLGYQGFGVSKEPVVPEKIDWDYCEINSNVTGDVCTVGNEIGKTYTCYVQPVHCVKKVKGV